MKDILIRLTRDFSLLIARPSKELNTEILSLAVESKKNFKEFENKPLHEVYHEMSNLVEEKNEI